MTPTPRTVVNQQAEDEGLWFIAATAPEAYLQQELRRLHTVIEAQAAAPDALRAMAEHLIAEAANGPWRRELNVAGDEEEHMVWLTNDARDTLMLNADDVAVLVNAALAAPAEELP